MANSLAVEGLLFDLDGVLYIGAQPVPGAVDAVRKVRASGIICRFVTNTSTMSLASLQAKFAMLGFDIPASEIISAPQAAIRYLKAQGDPVCRLLLADDVKADFKDFRQSDTEAEYIVVGDIGSAWTYQILNEVFNCLKQGAKLIAIHKNRFWQTEHGLQMDIGAFIHGLEYASNSEAMIIGKPSRDFFNLAVQDTGLDTSQVAIIGDDIDADVGGGQKAGLKGILVKTGKYRQAYTDASEIKPDYIIDSVADLPRLLGL